MVKKKENKKSIKSWDYNQKFVGYLERKPAVLSVLTSCERKKMERDVKKLIKQNRKDGNVEQVRNLSAFRRQWI